MPSSIKLSVEEVGFEASIRRAVARVAAGGGGVRIPINDKAFNTAIGGMTSNMKRFEQSLDFSNRRVIAFGTSASIVYGTVRALNELVKATVEVEKTLTSINSIFGTTARQLDTFSKGLFNVARETGQSFSEVAKAAEEFSRQGLGVEETLKRTRDVMVLVRLTGLDTAKAVGTLTAAVNTFAKAGEDSTSIINKVVAADQRFAVSARDIAEAFQRVGSVVDDAGVSIDQFIGLVTAAKQITSRDGAVIGNSLKTILTRLERPSTLDNLEALGIAVRDAAGNAKPALQVFDALAKTYGTLGREQQNLVAQLGGGMFQINQFKALMMDLGKANGVSAQAERAAANATNEAIVRNVALNTTLAASIQSLKNNATQLAAAGGQLAIKPALNNALDFGSFLTGGALQRIRASGDTKASEDVGAYIGESMLKGLGNVLGGPGLILALRAMVGVIRRTIPEVATDLVSATSMAGRRPGSYGTRIRDSLAPAGEAEAIARTNQLVAMGTKEEQARYAAARSVADQQAAILAILQRQALVTAEMAGMQRGIGAKVLAEEAALSAPIVRGLRGGIPRGASGYIPMGEEMGAIARGVGGASPSARPVYLPGFNRGGGQRGIVANTSEWIVPGASGGAIFNRDMVQRYGLPPGATPVAAEGHIPNAAFGVYMGATTPGATPSPSYPFGVLPGGPYASIAGGGGGGAMGQGFGQYTVAAEKALLEKQAQNAAYEARILAQREAVGKGEAQELAAERARIQALPRTVESRAWSGTPYAVSNAGIVSDGSMGRRQTRLASAEMAAEQMARAQQSATFDKVLAQRRAQAAQVRADLETQQRSQRFAGRMGNLQMGLLAGSFGAGFIDSSPLHGTTGQLSGSLSGAATGGIQAAAMGAFLGSVVGPMGTAIGAGVGGVGGAIKGFVDRMQKSFEEIGAEITKDNAKLKEEMDAVGRAFEIQEQLVEGGKSGMTRMQLARLQKELNSNLSKIHDPNVLRMVMSGGTDPSAISKVAQMEADKASHLSAAGGVRLAFSKTIGGSLGLGKASSEDVTSAAEAQAGQFANASDAQLALMAKRIRDPEYAAARGKMLGGESWIQRLNNYFPSFGIPGLLGKSPLSSVLANDNATTFTQDATIGAIKRETERRALMKQADARAKAGGGSNYMTRVESLALASRMGVAGQIAQVRAGGASQLAQVGQQIALEAPGLMAPDILAMQGRFGRQNIASQYAATRASTISSGTSALIESLGAAGVKDRGLLERISGAKGKDDLMSLQRDMTSVFANKAPAETLRKTQEALSDLIGRVTVLNATEQENIRVNDEGNKLMLDQLNYRRSRTGAAEYLRGELNTSADEADRAQQAIFDETKRGNKLVTGDMIGGALMGRADMTGRLGGSKDSFTMGFGSVMASAKQELTNFAQVGQTVALSLSNNLGNAFGDFITGASKGKDAFRDFALGVTREAARAFASKAVVSLLSMIFPASFGAATPTGSVGVGAASVVSATGGPIGRAAGGTIPTMLTSGEYVFTPGQASRIGGRRLGAINSGTMRGFAPGGLVSGGSGARDDVFQPLAVGSYVVRKSSVERYGASNLAALAVGGYPEGGAASSMMIAPSPMGGGSGGGAGGVFTIGVTINDNTVRSESSSKTEGSGMADRQFGDTLARRIKSITLQTIEEQKRGGGILRPQSNLRPS